MGIRFALARGVATVSTWGLKHVFRRPAANFPGKIALYVDPSLVEHLASRVDASVCVVGTNGKTTCTNLLADALEAAGFRVVCNRTGANLDSGVTTALLHAKRAGDSADFAASPSLRSAKSSATWTWGVFECDELWLAKITPGLQPKYVLLLNLFRDQLDRVGEIDHIQESIARALASSPDTTLIYNADDPLCQAIAERVANRAVGFGLAQDLGLAQNVVADARMCQRCATLLEYEWRQYGQLGAFRCPNCGFARMEPDYAAREVLLGDVGVRLDVVHQNLTDGRYLSGFLGTLESSLAGAYMAYNLLAVATAADLAGAPFEAVQQAVRAFNPHNGRLESYEIGGRSVLLNLAKNPTGFNQNLDIVLAGSGQKSVKKESVKKSVAFYINDKEADGHDVSWLWDIDFQNLASAAASGELTVFAGGLRRNDMQVRLKYAGIHAELVDGVDDFLARSPEGAHAYVIANYTALPGVKATLDRLAKESVSLASLAPEEEILRYAQDDERGQATPCNTPMKSNDDCNTLNINRPLTIVHLFPTLLNLYGDNGNVTVLAQRARARGLDAHVVAVERGDAVDWDAADVVFLGGGPDREQRLAADCLAEMADDLRAFVESDGVVLAICGGFQIIGREWLMGDETVPGLGILGMTTQRAEGGSHNRLVGNVALDSPLASMPVVGYENHAGRTFLDEGVKPFGRVRDGHGNGNNGRDGADGALYRNVVGTYLHGPLLAKNPEVADVLLARALKRRLESAGASGSVGSPVELPALDDSEERAANAYLLQRMG